MLDAVFIFQMDARFLTSHQVHQRIDSTSAILIQHKDLLKLCLRVAEQFKAVFLRTCQSTLMREDNLTCVIFKAAQADETFPQSDVITARHPESLEINEEGRLRKQLQHAGRAPVLEICGRAGVDVV